MSDTPSTTERPAVTHSNHGVPRFGMYAGPGYAGGREWNEGQVPDKAAWTVTPVNFLDDVTRNHDKNYTYVEQTFNKNDPAQAAAYKQGLWQADKEMLVNVLSYQPAAGDWLTASYRDALIRSFAAKAVNEYGIDIQKEWAELGKLDANYAKPAFTSTSEIVFGAPGLVHSASTYMATGMEQLSTSGVNIQAALFFNQHIDPNHILPVNATGPDGQPLPSWEATNRIVIPQREGSSPIFSATVEINGQWVKMKYDEKSGSFTREVIQDGTVVSKDEYTAVDSKGDKYDQHDYNVTRATYRDGEPQVETSTLAKPAAPSLLTSEHLTKVAAPLVDQGDAEVIKAADPTLSENWRQGNDPNLKPFSNPDATPGTPNGASEPGETEPVTFTPVPYTLPDGTEGIAYAAPDRPALITTETGDRYTVGIDGQVTLLDPAPPGNPALEPVVFHSGGDADDSTTATTSGDTDTTTPATAGDSSTTPNPLDGITPYVAGVNSALTLIQSIQQGNTLSAVLAGASLANTVNQLATGSTAPIVPGDLTAGLTVLSTGLNLLDALDHHDTLGALTAGTNLASQAAGLWASSLSNQGAALIASGALSEGAALVAEANSINALSNALGEVAGAFNIVNSLAHHDPLGAVTAVLMMNPATAPIGIAISIGRAILGGLLGGDEGEPAYVWVKATGDAQFIRTDTGIEIHSSGTNEHKSTEGSAVGEATQGGFAVAGALGDLFHTLQSRIDAHNAAHPESPLALIPERLPELHFRDPAYYAQWTDAATGEVRSIAVGRATLAEDLLAVAQSGQAVVPQWQADSISQRIEHGQAEAWRSAPAPEADGDTRSQDILVLGSGRMEQIVRADVDGDGWLEAHGWSVNNVYLALDRQGDGRISGRDDLLTRGDGGANSLGWLDANGDGKLDKSDPGFAALKVWLDANGDAVAQDNELAGVTAANIVAIDFNSYPPQVIDATGKATALTEAQLSGDTRGIRATEVTDGTLLAQEAGETVLLATRTTDYTEDEGHTQSITHAANEATWRRVA